MYAYWIVSGRFANALNLCLSMKDFPFSSSAITERFSNAFFISCNASRFPEKISSSSSATFFLKVPSALQREGRVLTYEANAARTPGVSEKNWLVFTFVTSAHFTRSDFVMILSKTTSKCGFTWRSSLPSLSCL